MDGSMDIGKQIRYFRKRANLTQEKLGFDAELGQKFISELERGQKMPTVRTLEKIAAALGISVAHLCAFGNDNDPDSISTYVVEFETLIKDVPADMRDKTMDIFSSVVDLMRNNSIGRY